MNNNASMEEVYKAEVECLRKQLAEKDKKIAYLEMQLDHALKEYDELIQGENK